MPFKSKEDRATEFFLRVEVTPSGCWNWLGGHFSDGYGTFWDNKRAVYAHKFSYEQLVGVVPIGLDLDHLCHNRGCVNPQHLEAVTHGVNVRRGLAPRLSKQRQTNKTHCPYGHPYNEINTVWVKNGRWRECRLCRKRYRQERREAIREYNREYRRTHKEQLKEYNKKYYESHKQWILAKKRTESVVTVTSVPRAEKNSVPRRKSIVKPRDEKKKRGSIILDPKPVNEGR